MDATVSASVMWHGFETYPFTFSIKNYYIKVADTTDYDRSLCNCTQMMQASWQDPHQQYGQTSMQLPLFTQFEGGGRGGGAEGEGEGEGEGRGDGALLAADDVLLPPTMGEKKDVRDRIAMQ